MKLTIESTDQLVPLAELPELSTRVARVWRGKTEAGVPVFVFVVNIAVHMERNAKDLEAELTALPAPLRLVHLDNALDDPGPGRDA